MSTKLRLPMCDLRCQKIIEAREYEMTLTDTFFSVKQKFRASEPQEGDDKLPWIEVDNDFEMLYPKHRFAGIEKVWMQEAKRWKIIISIDGVRNDLRIYFKKQHECEEVFNGLVYYFFHYEPFDKKNRPM